MRIYVSYIAKGHYDDAEDTLDSEELCQVAHSYGDLVVVQDVVYQDRKWIIKDQTVDIVMSSVLISTIKPGQQFKLTQSIKVMALDKNKIWPMTNISSREQYKYLGYCDGNYIFSWVSLDQFYFTKENIEVHLC